MKNKNKRNQFNCILMLFLLLGMIMVVMMQGVFALENSENITDEQKAKICLRESEDVLKELIDTNFSIERVNDTLNEAKNLFDAQNVLKEKKKETDFSIVVPYCDEIQQIKINAFNSRDEFLALEKFYEETFVEGMNTTDVGKIIAEIENELESERYEKIPSLIDEAYEEIINMKSSHTTLNLFYTSTKRSLKKFFLDNWIYLSVFVAVLAVLFLIYKKAISKWIIKRKLNNLEIRKKTIKGLIMHTQREYFDKGKLPEGIYNVRIKKFGELIRDIDRQIPLLKEELVKVSRTQNERITKAKQLRKDFKKKNEKKKK